MTPTTDYPPLQGDATVDVAVIGGGIVGVTAAVMLKRAGARVAVIEARRIGAQVTGHSTAKITSQHSLIYADLLERLGEDKARLYAEANETALRRIADFVAEKDIACDFERAAAHTFTCSRERIADVEREVEAARKLGLPASFTDRLPLPYEIAAAVRFDNQAQFNPQAYLRALADEIPGGGSLIFEQTRAHMVREGSPRVVETDRGTVSATDVIVATNMPFIGEGDFYKKARPRAHLALAASITAAAAPDGMFLSIDPPTHSIRTAPDSVGRLLVVIGESFATGHVRDTTAMYRELEAFVRDRFNTADIRYRWANEDYDSTDRVPFVGPADKGTGHLYVATGFCSWGITNGTAAGLLLADQIGGTSNPWTQLYDATRSPGTAPNNGQPPMRDRKAQKQAPASYAELAPGEGAVFEVGDQPVGVYKDDRGQLHAISATCTHRGCEVTWNSGNRTWDCTCHGSTFAADGTVIHGPATKNLAQRHLGDQQAA